MNIGVLSGVLAGWLALGAAMAEEAPLQLATLASEDQATPLTRTTPWDGLDPKDLELRSEAAFVVDLAGNVVYAKNAEESRPIASITKLMTAMVILDSGLPLDEPITITQADRDLIKLTGSRLVEGATLPRGEVVRLALLASENRAANALARNYPGGHLAFVTAMNEKAQALGMSQSRFLDPAGLAPDNVASARDVATMIRAARDYPLIVEATTTSAMTVYPFKDRGPLRFVNTNRLVNRANWDIGLSKTGYINEAGRCLAMQAVIADRRLTIVLLDAFGKLTPFGDSNRLRQWIESSR